MILDSGLDYLTTLLSVGLYLAVGTNDTPAAPGQTALLAEIAREEITVHSEAGGVITFQVYFTGAQVGGETLNEFGLFPGASGVDGIERTVHTEIIPAGSGLLVSWSLQATR